MGPHNKSQLYIFERLVCILERDKRLFFSTVVNLLKKQKKRTIWEKTKSIIVLAKHHGMLSWSIREEIYQEVTTSQNHSLSVVVFTKRWSSTFDWREECWQQTIQTEQPHTFQRGWTMHSNGLHDEANHKKDQIVTISFIQSWRHFIQLYSRYFYHTFLGKQINMKLN